MGTSQSFFATTGRSIKAIGILTFTAMVFWLGGATRVHAQNFQVGGYFTPVFPRGEFKENVSNNGYGGGGFFLVRLGDSPLMAGGDFGIVVYGSETHEEPISTTIPSVIVNVRTSNNIFLGHALLRMQPRSGPILPYLDGLIGMKHLFTMTTISDDFSVDPIASTTNLSDTAFSYGVGAGVQVPLFSPKSGGGIMLDGSVRYLRGGRADYLRKGSIHEVNGQAFFDVFSSRTDVIAVQIGVTFRF